MMVADDRTGLLVGGHGRYDTLVAKHAAGDDPPDGIRLGADGEWWVPVIHGWASTDDNEATAAAIALNVWVERGGWDNDRLAPILARQAALDGLGRIGFTPDDLAAIVKATSPENWDGDRSNPDATARREATIDELAANYRNKQVRTLVLDYPKDEFLRVVALAADARKRHGTPGNAELLVALLRRWEAGREGT